MRVPAGSISRNYLIFRAEKIDWTCLMPTSAIIFAALLTLTPFLAAAFFPARLTRVGATLPTSVRLFGPAVLCVPSALVSCSAGIFRWGWLALYALLPVSVATLMWQARRVDPDRHGNW